MTPNAEKWILAGIWTAVLTSLLFGHWIWAVAVAVAGVIFQERGRFVARDRRQIPAPAHRAKVPENPVPADASKPIDSGAENTGTEAALALDVERLHALVEDERQAEVRARGHLARRQEPTNRALPADRTGPRLNESLAKAPSDVGSSMTIEQWRSMSPSEREAFIASRDPLSHSNHTGGAMTAVDEAVVHGATRSSDSDKLDEPSSEFPRIDPRAKP